MNATLFTPLPPSRTGVAHYASILIPALAQRLDLEVISEDNRQPAAGNCIYQLGNNLQHEWIFRRAMEHPGVIVLHDIVLHHLIVEMTLARGDVEGYIAALRANHGEAGAAWARGRAAGLHSEMGNFLLPASIEVANRSHAVIVHNAYAAERLRSLGVRTPVRVVPHPYTSRADPRSRRDEIRSRHGFTNAHRVLGLFGFLTSAKRSEVVLEAFEEAREKNSNLRLLVVGEPAPNIDTAAFAADGITFTGFVDDDEFDAYFDAVDRVVNLRYPSAGETSGTLIRAFAAGKPVAVSDYAQFAELPDACAVKIPFGEREVEALADYFLRDLPDPAAAQRHWLEENARIDLTVDGYLRALEDSELRTQDSGLVTSSLPLFPKLEIVSIRGNAITIRNAGDSTLRTAVYGEPGYQLIVNGRWRELPRDLQPGQMAEISVPDGSVTLAHALQGIPMLEEEAWGRVTIR